MRGLGTLLARGRRPARVAAAGLIGTLLACTPVLGSSVAAAAPLDITGTSCEPADPASEISGLPWPQEQTEIRKAWQYSDVGAGVRIAVIDTGFDAGHPQLQNITSENVPGTSFIGGHKPDLPAFRDCVGHGTRVTSVIAAQPSSEEGVEFAGVAPAATVIPIRVQFDDDFRVTNQDIADGIDYAVESGAHIINVSLETFDSYPELGAAVGRAEEAGVLIVAAAGNNGDQPAYPAKYSEEYSNVISVGAVGEDGVLMGGSANPSSGSASNTSLVAPGVQVPTAIGEAGHTLVDGTSFAAPFVSGVAALVLNNYPDLSPAEVKRRLEITAEHTGVDLPHPAYGWGMVNPVAAVTAVLPPDLSDINKHIVEQTPEQIAPIATGDGDTTTRDRALFAAGGACGASLVAVAVAYVYRRGRARNWKPGLPETTARA